MTRKAELQSGFAAADVLGRLGAIVRARRQARGWSLRQLATFSNVSSTSLCNFENQQAALDLGPFFRVAAALNLPVLPGLFPAPGQDEVELLFEVLVLIMRAPPSTLEAVQTLLQLGEDKKGIIKYKDKIAPLCADISSTSGHRRDAPAREKPRLSP